MVAELRAMKLKEAAKKVEGGTDQHQSGVAVRERSHHAGSAADLTVQPFDHVVGADARLMLTGEIAVGQRLLNASLRHVAGTQWGSKHEAPGGSSGRRLHCRLTSFSRSLQIILRINLDWTESIRCTHVI